jgi:hypothetical protein
MRLEMYAIVSPFFSPTCLSPFSIVALQTVEAFDGLRVQIAKLGKRKRPRCKMKVSFIDFFRSFVRMVFEKART